MLIKLIINLDTLDAVCEDPTITVNDIGVSEGNLILELSRPDPEMFDPNNRIVTGI
jgi:hypothetical protein